MSNKIKQSYEQTGVNRIGDESLIDPVIILNDLPSEVPLAIETSSKDTVKTTKISHPDEEETHEGYKKDAAIRDDKLIQDMLASKNNIFDENELRETLETRRYSEWAATHDIAHDFIPDDEYLQETRERENHSKWLAVHDEQSDLIFDEDGSVVGYKKGWFDRPDAKANNTVQSGRMLPVASTQVAENATTIEDVQSESTMLDVINRQYAPVSETEKSKMAKSLAALKSAEPQAVESKEDTAMTEDAKNIEIMTHYDAMRKIIMNNCVCNIKGALYYFNGTVYELLTEGTLPFLVFNTCREEIKSAGSVYFVTGVKDMLKMEPDLVCTPLERPDLVAFKNGVLNLSNNDFCDPNPNFFLTSYINLDYAKEGSMETPNFDAFLQTVSGGTPDLIARIWEIIGYLLTPDMSGKCFFVFQGVGDSGKSVLGRFISSLFDENATANIDVFRMGDRFSLYGLVGKRLNASLDLPNGRLNTSAVSIIKQLTGGDVLTAEAKYANSFSFKNTCKLLFASNHTLQLSEYDEAFERRIVLVPFNYAIPRNRQDPALLDKFEKEKLAIVKKGLLAYKRLKANKYVFSGEECIQPFGSDMVSISTDTTVRRFIDDCCTFVEIQPKEGTHTAILHERYQKYCWDNAVSPIDKMEKFSSVLKYVCDDKVKDDRWRADGRNANGYLGIKLKED